jgi:uncharacterized UBP type Zn finger protein
MAVSMPNASPNGSAPRCEHGDLLVPVVPQADRCRECEVRGAGWLGLVVCLTCGWVACSDDSPHRHAMAHYEETDHPLAAGLEPGLQGRWCYVHRRTV